ncbi:hypothetical protein M1O20_01975 [Dehalococcoidia bacterium]|nr:hypothetical protein [Dehalococcoidia bacterium]MCL0078524.1 hypothetical protein [Dehalococcoidia bacterium]MCL0092386.1 hypothetical protein [Dehalococcoidia bacterium]MCL0099220.1 hypothetical protein [Dehalococcoidia bacterium]
MRKTVYLYHLDTGEWPTEWSEGDLSSGSSDRGDHQLWGSRNDGDTDDVGGWDGPYVDRHHRQAVIPNQPMVQKGERGPVLRSPPNGHAPHAGGVSPLCGRGLLTLRH